MDTIALASVDTEQAAGPSQVLTLPVSGWHVDWHEDRNGRAVLEIENAAGDLVGLAISSTLALLSVDAAWRGTAVDPAGVRRWWALAIGHATTTNTDPEVTFTRRAGATGRTWRSVVRPTPRRGLWIAAVPGAYTAVSCSQDTAHRIRRLAPVPIFSHS